MANKTINDFPSNSEANTTSDDQLLLWDTGTAATKKVSVADLGTTINAAAPSVAVDDLSDVTEGTPADGDILEYDNVTSKWISATPSGGASAISDLTDVDTTGAASTNILTFNGANWVDSAAPATVAASNIGDLADVTGGSESDGDVLTYDNGTSKWVSEAPSGGAVAIDDLTDVTEGTPADGDLLTYDDGTSKWISEAPAAAAVAIDDLTDVTEGVPADGDLLTYDDGTSKWISEAPAAAAVSYPTQTTVLSGGQTLSAGDMNSTWLVDPVDPGSTLSLPAVSTLSNGEYVRFIIIDDLSTNGILIKPNSADLAGTVRMNNIDVSTGAQWDTANAPGIEILCIYRSGGTAAGWLLTGRPDSVA